MPQHTTSLQARDLGFQVAANRIEELQAVVSKIAEDAASGNDSPVGIPPQRAKPAGVKPDPKARPFTPGMDPCTDFVHLWLACRRLAAVHRNVHKCQH